MTASGHDAGLARERLALFQRTGDPASLWPGLTESARVAAAREIERAARHVLSGRRRVPLDPLGEHEPYALGIAGHTTGMGPLIGRWIEDGRLIASAPVRARFAEHIAHGRRRAARMHDEVLPAIDALLARGIRPIVLKGFHTGRAYFEEPGARRMADVDLLISPAQVRDAERALSAVGFRPEHRAHRPYKRDWVGPGVDSRLFSVELSDARSKWVLELHVSLDQRYHPGAVARLDRERHLLEPLDVAGRPLLALAPPLLLVALACHCSRELDGVRLLRVVEMVYVIRRGVADGRLQWDDVLGILHRTGCAPFTYPALALVEQLVPRTVHPRVLARGRETSTWAALHTVERLVPAGGSLDDSGVARQLMWTRGVVAYLHRALRNLWPASFLRPADVQRGWRIRLRRLRAGLLTLGAPDERQIATPSA